MVSRRANRRASGDPQPRTIIRVQHPPDGCSFSKSLRVENVSRENDRPNADAYVPFSSLESVIEQSKEAYYLALRQT
jgi:hypothetical protein